MLLYTSDSQHCGNGGEAK